MDRCLVPSPQKSTGRCCLQSASQATPSIYRSEWGQQPLQDVDEADQISTVRVCILIGVSIRMINPILFNCHCCKMWYVSHRLLAGSRSSVSDGLFAVKYQDLTNTPGWDDCSRVRCQPCKTHEYSTKDYLKGLPIFETLFSCRSRSNRRRLCLLRGSSRRMRAATIDHPFLSSPQMAPEAC